MQNKNDVKSNGKIKVEDIQLKSINASENSYNFSVKGKKVKIVFCQRAEASTVEDALVKIAIAGWE